MLKKSLFGAIAIVLFSMLSFVVISCKNDKKSDPSPVQDPPKNKPFETKIIGKWNVGNGSGRINSNTSGYTSFEFTLNGGYIVGKADGSFLTGSYTINTASKEITLGTFGVVTVTKIEGSVLDFTLRLTGTSTDIQIFSNKTGSLISNSSRTDSLCQSWTMVTKYDNGVENTAVTNAIASGSIKGTVVISTYGTFLTIQEQTGMSTVYNNGVWNWKAADQKELCTGVNCANSGAVVFIGDTFHYTYTSLNNVVIEEVYQKVN